jgi:plastocyanin
MRLPLLFVTAAALIGGFARLGASIDSPVPSTPPATQPMPATTLPSQPVGYSIRGRVSFASGLALQKPDLSRVIVYLASDPALDGPPLSEKVSVAQRNKAFVPNFAVVQLGTGVEFPNYDHFDHNVFSRSKAAPAFDLDRYPYGQSKSRVFDKVGVVQVFCNIHPAMRAMIVVTPNRYFTRVDAEGRFEIAGVPAGKYQLTAFHERCEEQHRGIQAGPNASDETTFIMEENRKSIMANDPPERRGGYGVERGLGAKREQLNLPVVKESHPAPDASGH